MSKLELSGPQNNQNSIPMFPPNDPSPCRQAALHSTCTASAQLPRSFPVHRKDEVSKVSVYKGNNFQHQNGLYGSKNFCPPSRRELPRIHQKHPPSWQKLPGRWLQGCPPSWQKLPGRCMGRPYTCLNTLRQHLCK